MCACISVSEESTRKNVPLHMDCGEKKMLVGHHFKSKATQCVSFGTATQKPNVKDTT